MERSLKKYGWCGLLLAAVLFAAAAPAGQTLATWGDIAAEMEKCLQDAHGKYANGDVEGAKKRVNDAYFGYYEKMGFERTVLSYISGRRASEVEYKFAAIKRAMTEGKSLVVVKNELDGLAKMLRDDADRLDGKEESPVGTFVASLLILTARASRRSWSSPPSPPTWCGPATRTGWGWCIGAAGRRWWPAAFSPSPCRPCLK